MGLNHKEMTHQPPQTSAGGHALHGKNSHTRTHIYILAHMIQINGVLQSGLHAAMVQEFDS